jgi:hypothetical protein
MMDCDDAAIEVTLWSDMNVQARRPMGRGDEARVDAETAGRPWAPHARPTDGGLAARQAADVGKDEA